MFIVVLKGFSFTRNVDILKVTWITTTDLDDSKYKFLDYHA